MNRFFEILFLATALFFTVMFYFYSTPDENKSILFALFAFEALTLLQFCRIERLIQERKEKE